MFGACIAGGRMWWFRFLSPGHEIGHTLHLAIAVPAPGFSAGEDTKVTKHVMSETPSFYLLHSWHCTLLSSVGTQIWQGYV